MLILLGSKASSAICKEVKIWSGSQRDPGPGFLGDCRVTWMFGMVSRWASGASQPQPLSHPGNQESEGHPMQGGPQGEANHFYYCHLSVCGVSIFI